MTVTVWWKSGMDKFTEFTNIVETDVSEFSNHIIFLNKDNDNAIYINANEVMYVEEEEEETE